MGGKCGRRDKMYSKRLGVCPVLKGRPKGTNMGEMRRQDYDEGKFDSREELGKVGI